LRLDKKYQNALDPKSLDDADCRIGVKSKVREGGREWKLEVAMDFAECMEVWFRRGFFCSIKGFCNCVLSMGDIKKDEDEAVVGERH